MQITYPTDGFNAASWFRTAKNFVGLKTPTAVVPTGKKVLFYFNTAPNQCGKGYAPRGTAVPSTLWFELNDLAGPAGKYVLASPPVLMIMHRPVPVPLAALVDHYPVPVALRGGQRKCHCN